MCQLVIIDGVTIANTQKLANYLGVTPRRLVWDGKPMWSKNVGYSYCLCPINLEATAHKFGYKVSSDDGWGTVLFYKEDCPSAYYAAITA